MMVAAISIDSLLHFRFKIGAYNSDTFIEFLNEVHDVLQRQNNELGSLFVMDNVPFHKTAAVQQSHK
ncbi:14836_t:CDS:2 [Entrophospora sp. SA101]|nr:14836_t:CDS:2 [Entrophospora sp. SA101]